MATYRRKGRNGIAATQFSEPNFAPPPPPGITVSWQYTSKGSSMRIKDDWWIVPNEDTELPDIVMGDAQFQDTYEEEP